MKRFSRLLTTLLSTFLVASLAAQDTSPPPPVLERGMTGYGLSVFQGEEPERFDVEVIGVLRHATAELSYVLARLSGQDLESSGVAAGMSGSPVYIDGKLIGAVSFSYNFSQNAFAGITPIDGMRRLGDLADPTAISASTMPWAPSTDSRPAISVPSLDDLLARRFDVAQLDRALAVLRAPPAPDGHAAVVWQASGFGDDATARLRKAVGTLATVGSATDEVAVGDDPMVAGAAIAMLLVTGDLSLAAHGTVTEVRGDRLIAFGHSVFGLGPTRVPMARSEVLTTVASLASSFKLSNAGAVIGAFDQDREAGARGVIGLDAPMIPLTVSLRGAAERDYRMRLADVRPLLPTLVTLSVFGALNAGSWSAGEMAINLDGRIRIHGHDELHLRQRFDGGNAGVDSVLYLLNVVAYLVGNELEAARIEGLDIVLEQEPLPRVATLVAAHADRRQVAPGDAVGVTLEMQPFRGERERHRLTVTIPEHLDDGTYAVLIGDGPSIDGALRTVVPEEPRTLSEALDQLGRFTSRDQLAILGLVSSRGLAIAGSVLPALPDSMRALLEGSSQPTTALALRAVDHQIHPAPVPLSGLVRIDFNVEKRRH